MRSTDAVQPFWSLSNDHSGRFHQLWPSEISTALACPVWNIRLVNGHRALGRGEEEAIPFAPWNESKAYNQPERRHETTPREFWKGSIHAALYLENDNTDNIVHPFWEFRIKNKWCRKIYFVMLNKKLPPTRRLRRREGHPLGERIPLGEGISTGSISLKTRQFSGISSTNGLFLELVRHKQLRPGLEGPTFELFVDFRPCRRKKKHKTHSQTVAMNFKSEKGKIISNYPLNRHTIPWPP